MHVIRADRTTFAYLCDPRIQANCRANGDDPERLPQTYADAINAAIRDRPEDMRITIHTCRGNFKSAWVAEGGYDPVVEAMFSTDAVERTTRRWCTGWSRRSWATSNRRMR